MHDFSTNFLFPLLVGLFVGLVLWYIGKYAENRKIKSDAIRDLMTYRGDFASADFRRALNKVSIIFHNQEYVRTEVRHLYEVINSGSNNAEQTKRAIVGLIYKLCQKNGFKGLTEYDIDQAFAEAKQAPLIESSLSSESPAVDTPVPSSPPPEAD